MTRIPTYPSHGGPHACNRSQTLTPLRPQGRKAKSCSDCKLLAPPGRAKAAAHNSSHGGHLRQSGEVDSLPGLRYREGRARCRTRVFSKMPKPGLASSARHHRPPRRVLQLVRSAAHLPASGQATWDTPILRSQVRAPGGVVAFRKLAIRYDRHAAAVLAFLHLARPHLCALLGARRGRHPRY